MENYSRSEKIDMLLVFGECRQNSTAAAQLYAERYPERRHPTRHYFPKLVQKMRIEPENVENAQFIISEDKEIDVLAYVQVNINSSVREIATECQISRNSAWRILRKHNYHSYKYQLHQYLYQDDHVRRVEYCNWYLQKYLDDNSFPFKILYSDESRFTNLGVFNRNNKRYWAQENLHLMEEGNFQERFGFNCWIGILGDRILGPIIFDGHLTGERYLNFLTQEIEQFLDEIPINNRIGLFFQQDGAPPHNTMAVRDYLNYTYGENWIGNNGPVRWPPRYSLQLTCYLIILSSFYILDHRTLHP